MTDYSTRLAALGMELPEVEAWERDRERIRARNTDPRYVTNKAEAALAAVVGQLEQYDAECIRLTELMERAEKCAVEEGVKRAEAAQAATIEVLNDCQAEMGRQCARADEAEAENARLRNELPTYTLVRDGDVVTLYVDGFAVFSGPFADGESADIQAAVARKDAVIADLKRIVGKQEQELAEAELKIRELRVRGGGGA